MYYTVKFDNTNAHRLDEFEDINAAIESARTLHNPDWPCWQGIRIKEGETHETVFDSQKDRGAKP